MTADIIGKYETEKSSGIKDRHKAKNDMTHHDNSGASHHNSNAHDKAVQSQASLLLWMLVDGIGLAIIAGATLLEGVKLWNEYFHVFWETNPNSLGFWFSGRTCQLIGLFFLIGEHTGCDFIPKINSVCFLFRSCSKFPSLPFS
jgi:hypothetical protein